MSNLLFDHSEYVRHLEIEIQTLQDYLTFTEVSHRTLYDQISENYEARIKKLSEEDKSYVVSFREDDLGEAKEFLNTLRYSLVVTCYSRFELFLANLCTMVRTKLQSKVRLSHLKGRGLGQVKDYLKIVGDVDFSQMGGPWGRVSESNEVRNNIVHQNGNITEATKSLLNIISRSSYLSSTGLIDFRSEEHHSSGAYIEIVDTTFLYAFTESMDDVLIAIHQQLADKHN